MTMTILGLFGTGVAAIAVTVVAFLHAQTPEDRTRDNDRDGGIHKIKHVIVIMQENRSFDTYFGTYPGADGIPTQNSESTVCVPDPKTSTCVKPFHNSNDSNFGGPHGMDAAKQTSMGAR